MDKNRSSRDTTTQRVEHFSDRLLEHENALADMSLEFLGLPRVLADSSAEDATPAALDELRDRIRGLDSVVSRMVADLAVLRRYADDLPVDR